MPSITIATGRALLGAKQRGNSIHGGGFFGVSASRSIRGGGEYGVIASQSINGGGEYGAITSQSINGGGSYGVIGSQSIEGGGSVATFPWQVHGYGLGCSLSVGFFRVSALPASDMTIFDVNLGGAIGYYRIKLTSAGKVVAELALSGSNNSLDSGVGAILPGDWNYFVGGGVINGTLYNSIQVWQAGGVTPGQKLVNTTAAQSPTTYTSIVGFGVSVSSAYLNFPNSGNNNLSKMAVIEDASFSVPTTDWLISTTGIQGGWNCRDALGVAATIVDVTGTYPLSAGPQGMTVVVPGPFV